MALWSTKRRLIYGGSVILVLASISAVVFFRLLYHAPTCSDGFKNGDEQGIDCGGSCQFICTSDSLEPVVLWSKVFNISGDVYSAVAYIENPNINSRNQKAKYQFNLFDAKNNLITSVEGQTNIPKNKKFAVFETGVVIKSAKPKSAEFKFVSYSKWQKDTQKEPDVSLKYSSLLATSTVPRIEGTITNDSLVTIPELELTVFVLDSKENVIATSRTFIENLFSRSTQDFVFTWPKTFDLGVEACVNPLDVSVILDRSGSMKSESVSPPEPFNTVKSTAQDFIKNLSDDDQVSVISFGDNAREESVLSTNKQFATYAIDNLFLSTTTSEQTNITDGLIYSWNELQSSRVRQESKKVLILLTDGTPTEPKNTGQPDYPVISAQSIAKDINDHGANLYTIGLGKNISEGFLKTISTDDLHYFFAPNKEALSNIYSNIKSKLCAKKPSVITVIYRTI